MSLLHPFHEFPKHLHHPDPQVDPIVAHNAAEEHQARLMGFEDNYVPKDYPKHIVTARDEHGFPTATREVKSAEEEKALLESLTPKEPAPDAA